MRAIDVINSQIVVDNRRILVIDDNPAIHKDYRKILVSTDEHSEVDGALSLLLGEAQDEAKATFEISSAYQGQEGLEMVREAQAAAKPFALAFVDMRMPPGWDGLETIEQLWKEAPDLQIVICTAFSDYSWKDVSTRIGHTDNLLVLKKPFDIIEVQQLATAMTRKWVINDAAIETRSSLCETINDLCALNQELEARNGELEDFTFMASHDLQEPLSKLVSFSQLLVEDAGEELSGDAKCDLDHIISAARRMKALLGDLLDLSQARKSEMNREWLDLRQCFDDVIESNKERIDASSAVFEWDKLPEVHADRRLLRQALGNLIGNAIKYVAEGGTPRVRITCTEESDLLTVGVLDEGIGIAPKYREKIFAPFKRLHGRYEYSGTGIGLAICHKIIDRHQGRIWVESGACGGSHFKIQFQSEDIRMPQAAGAD